MYLHIFPGTAAAVVAKVKDLKYKGDPTVRVGDHECTV